MVVPHEVLRAEPKFCEHGSVGEVKHAVELGRHCPKVTGQKVLHLDALPGGLSLQFGDDATGGGSPSSRVTSMP